MRTEVLIAVVAAAAIAVSAVQAHQPPRATERELVRVQGYRTKAAVPEGKHQLVLRALGVEQSFAATDWQVFGFSEAATGAPPAPPKPETKLALQGSRETLRRFAAARPEQLVTILAERRPGATDLFVLTLDLCPR